MPATLPSRDEPRRARAASTAIQAAMISSPYISRSSSMPTVRILSANYARTSFSYAIRCVWSASGPFRRFRSSMYAW